METIKEQYLEGERALFHSRDLQIEDTMFANGESPLKESKNLTLRNCIFAWKYPLWYCENVELTDSSLLETARSGIWYTHHITVRDTLIEAPKTFRRGSDICLRHVDMPLAQETLWNCREVTLDHVTARGDYFAMNARGVRAEHLRLTGNYCFDGARDIVVRNSTLLSKDAFWNTENVEVHDSTIIGEYLGWNSRNLTFVNCTIESLQGLCYIENLKLVNCKLLHTSLAMEYSTLDATVTTTIDSVKNPISGTLRARGIRELILEENRIDPTKTKILLEETEHDL